MNIPSGLKHVLDVYRFVNESKYSYTEAFKKVATKGRITEASVRSACTRDIGINTEEFDMFLDPLNADDFKSHLMRRYPPHQDFIRQFINKVLGKDEDKADEISKIVDTLFDDEKETLITKVLLKTIVEKCEKWVSRDDIPTDIKVEILEWLKLRKSI